MNIFLERFLMSAAVGAFILVFISMRKKAHRLTRHSGGKSGERSEDEDTEGGFEAPGGFRNTGYAAGLPIPFIILLFLLLEAGGVACLALWNQFDSKWPGGLALVVVPILIWSILSEIGRHRALRFEEKLIQAVELLIAALRSGDTPRQALEGLVENADAPVREEFRKLLVKLDLGVSMRRALIPIVRGYDSEGLRLFASTMAAKTATGGDLIPVLESLDSVLRERLRHRIRVNSRLAGAKFAALMIGLSPYVLLVVFHLYKPEWLERVFGHPLGPTLFVSAICIQLLGFAGLVRMLRMEL